MTALVDIGPDLRAADPSGEETASREDQARLARLVRRSLGIDLRDSKIPLTQQRLAGRMRRLGLARLRDYLDLLEGSAGREEEDALISAVTTGVTQFFREAHHFETLEREVLPPLVARARAGGRVRIWSAGCSTGQEAHSIAACVLGGCPEAARLDVKVLATDISAEGLAQAIRGTYPAAEAAALPPERRRALFGADRGGATVRVRVEAAAITTFNRLNLVGPWPMRGDFDVIFCRNVAIYFDQACRERLWSRFADALAPGGMLFIGHSERVTGPASSCLGHAGITAYRKRPGPAPAPTSGS